MNSTAHFLILKNSVLHFSYCSFLLRKLSSNLNGVFLAHSLTWICFQDKNRITKSKKTFLFDISPVEELP